MFPKPVIKYLIIIFVIMASFVSASDITIAVLDFDNNSFFNPSEYDPLTKGLAEIFITELSQIQSVKIVERQELRALLDEMKLSQSGILNQNNSLKAGEMLGARNLVFGGFMVTPEKKIRIDIRIVEVETGLTVKASEVTGKTKQVLTLIRKLSKQMLDDLDVRLSRQEKKYLKNSDNIPIDAIIHFSRGLDYEDREQWGSARDSYFKALEIEPNLTSARISNRIGRSSPKDFPPKPAV